MIKVPVDMYRINAGEVKLVGKHTENYSRIWCIFD